MDKLTNKIKEDIRISYNVKNDEDIRCLLTSEEILRTPYFDQLINILFEQYSSPKEIMVALELVVVVIKLQDEERTEQNNRLLQELDRLIYNPM